MRGTRWENEENEKIENKKREFSKERTKPTPARVMVCSAFGKDGMMTTTMIVYVCGFFEVVVVWCG